ncbi:MAG TPA: flagellar M-ring protein FliF [Actinobacteria bacterium]|nr:flagellar M-ring protein FliF [Actinomycetota bacterium]
MAITDVFKQIQTAWGKLNLNQKLIIGLTVLILLIAVISLSYWAVRPSYSVLFSELSSDDAASIVSMLKEQNVSYRLKGNSVIEVPSNMVYETRLQVAAEGLPKGGVIGFEIFDQGGLSVSEFTQKLNYRRGLEGELSRTISQLSEIQGARVHIVIPEPSLYEEEEKPATASIVLKTKAGSSLSQNKVQGVVHLVASSVEGLKPENITVLDTSGALLSEATGDSETSLQAGLTKTQLESQMAYENKLEKSVQSMLEKVLGINKSVVRVSAELDFTQKQTESEIYEPSDDPVIRSEQASKEKYSGEGASSSGVPGVDSNVSTYPSTGTEGTSSSYSKTDTTKNYEVTKRLEHEIEPPGEIKRLSVAVIIDSTAMEKIQTEVIKNTIAAATGTDEERGDVLTVSSVPFDTSWAEKETKEIEAFQRQELYKNIGKIAAVVILIAVAAFVLFRLLSGKKKEEGFEFLPKQPLGISLAAKEEELTPEEMEKREVKEEVKRIAKEKPGEVAQMLKSWLTSKE